MTTRLLYALGCLSLVLGCASAPATDTQLKEAQPSLPAADTKAAAPESAPAPPPLSADERARDEGKTQALFASMAQSAPPPRVLFEVKTAQCCPNDKAKNCVRDCAQAQVLFYESPDSEAWGLGNLVVDAQSRLWIHDRVAERVVAFDSSGAVKSIVSTQDHRTEGTSLAHVTSDEVRLWIPANGSQPMALARYGFDGKYLGSSEVSSVMQSDTARSLWSMPQETNRFASLAPVRTYDVVDLALDGPTAAFSAKRPLIVNGHHYAFSCDHAGPKPAGTLSIDAHRVAITGCPGLQYVAADGGVIVGNARYDASAKLTGALLGPAHEMELGLGERGPVAIGPDGRAYSYVARKNSVQLVELAFGAP